MRDDTSQRNPGARGGEDRQGQLDEVGLPLEELVRRGAREILQRAIEAEVEATLEEFASVSLSDGRRAVVRNGYLPAREILTTVGSVEVQVPKVRDRSGAGVKFNSALAPPYVRRSARVAAALPWLYLKGISSGDLGEALAVLVGEDAKGLSPAALGRLKAEWSEEYQGWTRRDLTGKQYAYWWADGIYTTLCESDAPKLCLLVIIGVTADGTKEWVAIHDGLRESTESWLDVLRDLKERGLEAGPRLAVGDGALGFWKALDQVYPNTVHQRCWFHKLGNVLTDLPKSLQSKAKADLQAIWRAPTRKQAQQAFKRFRQLPKNNVTLEVACASLRRYSRITPSTKLIEMEKAETQLTDAVIRTIRDAARKLTGPKRRQFQAQVALDYFGGSARKAQTVFGWSGKTVALGLNELRTGITCVDSFAMRGRRKSEDAQPQLLEDIVALVEPQSQTDPKFQGRFQYTRMTAKAVRQALIDEKDWTDEQLPHENTIGVILNQGDRINVS